MDVAGLLAWLESLPQAAVLSCMGVLAAVENLFPPIPADVLVAFGAFLAARAEASAWPACLVVWSGNIAGAIFVYFIGRRYSSALVERRLHIAKTGEHDARLLAWYGRYGIAAFFLCRFVPGLRAVVPPVAGALRVPFAAVTLAMALASALWYGLITIAAFKAGQNFEDVLKLVARYGRWAAIGAAAVLLVAVLILWRSRRRAS